MIERVCLLFQCRELEIQNEMIHVHQEDKFHVVNEAKNEQTIVSTVKQKQKEIHVVHVSVPEVM